MTTVDQCFDNELSEQVWQRKYRYTGHASNDPEGSIWSTWRRVAHAVALQESTRHSWWTKRFLAMLEGFRFLPAGRILASAGTDYEATLFNCFVMGTIDDSVEGIFERLRESALTMQRGGGIGCDFSTLRPSGASAVGSGRTASGPVSFMHLWNTMCTTLLATGNRRGAMMGVLRCDHPDIVEFIEAKRHSGELANFNLSVQVTDDFMRAVAANGEWKLIFPADIAAPSVTRDARKSPGSDEAPGGKVHATTSAAGLWRRLVETAYETAEPGVLFIDRINALNNLYYREHITATNPCGEVPLPPFGACNLGSINLTTYVRSPFTSRARLDLEAIESLARDATRFLDNVIDLSVFPLSAQADEARTTRRIGLGVTGLADALIMLGYRYDSEAGREVARVVLRRIRNSAYEASIDLAREKGSFPCLDKEAFLDGVYATSLPQHIRDGIAQDGLRNSHLLAIAPAGSISILANNVSSGIEPVFAARMKRIVLGSKHERVAHEVADRAYSLWLQSRASGASLPDAFVTAEELSPEDHLLMAAALQPFVDNSISKTVNTSESISRSKFAGIYRRAFDLGLKGCTAFRANPTRGSVLSSVESHDSIHCCVPEREGD